MTEADSPMIGYVLKRFPVLSETFILNEIIGLESRGLRIHVFALERPNDPRFHEELSRLKARISYIPELFPLRFLLQERKDAARTFGKGHLRTLRYVLKHTNPTLFYRYLQSNYVSNAARRLGIVHFHSHFATRPTTIAFLSSMTTRIPYSFTAHAMDIYKRHVNPKTIVRKMEDARFVVTVSDFNKHFLEDISPRASRKIFKIHNGIRMDRFQPGNSPLPEVFTFLCVARFVEKKGHAVLLEACRSLQRRGLAFRCLLVGAGRLERDIREKIDEYRLHDSVKILGAQSQKEVLEGYRTSHAFVLPSIIGSDGNREGLPVSIVEALACGLPVITTPVTGIPEVIRHQRNGLLVPSRDVEGLAAAMERLMTDTPLFYELKKNTRSSVEKEFDFDQSISTLKVLFEQNGKVAPSTITSGLHSSNNGALHHV